MYRGCKSGEQGEDHIIVPRQGKKKPRSTERTKLILISFVTIGRGGQPKETAKGFISCEMRSTLHREAYELMKDAYGGEKKWNWWKKRAL